MKNANVDYCGVIMILRRLVKDGICTQKEAKRIADRYATQNGVEIILPV